jgi:Mu transposase, C-terminal domain
VRAFEFFQGTPKLVVPDNAKTGVTKACRYDPDLNPTYQEMAMHHGIGVVPARPYKPRDKAKVESGVQLAERWIIAALRHRKFFSIEELNQAIRELRDRINQRPFHKREGSRATQFAAVDKPVLSPLPAEPFDLSEWSRARVNIDYHIAFDTNYYSVPYNLVQELVEVRSTPTTIEIFHKSQRVASHLRGSWSRARGHDRRAPPALPPGAPGMDTVTDGELGTGRSAIPRWPTASSTGWFTTLIESKCRGIQCGRIGRSPPLNIYSFKRMAKRLIVALPRNWGRSSPAVRRESVYCSIETRTP